MKAFVIHAAPTSPEGFFLAYCIPGVTSIERTASLVVLRGEADAERDAADPRRPAGKSAIATLALGPGVTVVLGDQPPRGVHVPGADAEERTIGFEPPAEAEEGG